jgi:hypothetical protein
MRKQHIFLGIDATEGAAVLKFLTSSTIDHVLATAGVTRFNLD